MVTSELLAIAITTGKDQIRDPHHHQTTIGFYTYLFDVRNRLSTPDNRSQMVPCRCAKGILTAGGWRLGIKELDKRIQRFSVLHGRRTERFS
jgi:hypothetical protein